MSSSKPRIFIGIPCYDKVAPEVLEDYMRFMFHLGRRMPNYDFFLGVKPKSEQFRARNDIVQGALQTNCDWLLMLDDDMIINHFVTKGVPGEGDESYGFLEKMIAHNKDVCGVLYWQRGGDFDPVLMTKAGDSDGFRFLRESEIEHRLQKMDVVGGGCMLIRMRVFDKIAPPYFGPEFKYGTDVQICKRAAESGFEVWADTSIELGHRRMESVTVTSRNRHRLQMEHGVPGDVQRSLITSDIFTRVEADAVEYTGLGREKWGLENGSVFLSQRNAFRGTDAEWYRLYPHDRIFRQIAYNAESMDKRRLTEHVIGALATVRNKKVLDFGCGVGITAYSCAEGGHDVTACDIRGTGTFEFLKWRVAKTGLAMTFVDSEGGVPDLGDATFDCIIAMDSIEHIKNWRDVVRVLAEHLNPGGVLFSNNGILDDKYHPEHYEIENRDFIEECMRHGVMPYNQITFIKKGGPHAQSTNQSKNADVYAVAR